MAFKDAGKLEFFSFVLSWEVRKNQKLFIYSSLALYKYLYRYVIY